ARLHRSLPSLLRDTSRHFPDVSGAAQGDRPVEFLQLEQVRTGLPGGGSRVRTTGPSRKDAHLGGRRPAAKSSSTISKIAATVARTSAGLGILTSFANPGALSSYLVFGGSPPWFERAHLTMSARVRFPD